MLPLLQTKCTLHALECSLSLSHKLTIDKLLFVGAIILVTLCQTTGSRNIEQQHAKRLSDVDLISERRGERWIGPQSNLANSRAQAHSNVPSRKITSNTSTTIETSSRRLKRRIKSPTNALPEFSAPIGNVTAVLGRDVRLVCTVENLGHYQVSTWL